MRKMKLFASLGALCVALAVLAFGVYAATTVTYNINATVTYEFNDALVNLNSTIYSYNIESVTTAQNASTAATADGVTETTESTVVVVTYDAENGNKPIDPKITTSATGVEIDDQNSTQINDNRDFNFNNAYLYKVEITITTPAGDGVVINYSLPSVSTDQTNGAYGKVFVQAVEGNFESGTRLSNTGSATIAYYIGILREDITIGSLVPLVAGSISFSN